MTPKKPAPRRKPTPSKDPTAETGHHTPADHPVPGGRFTPEERFDDVIAELLATPGVTPPDHGTGFGSGALRFHNKIFAMLVRGRLVVKLPRSRVDALVAAAEGVRFDANKGTPMKEWFSLDPQSALAWLPLAQEALDFIGRR